ncbi:MAG: hypothetical protein JW866_02670 [Ignavibacteriales bacterium]|nr:hypothetical protein [Ignavibacteriales bacterium]
MQIVAFIVFVLSIFFVIAAVNDLITGGKGKKDIGVVYGLYVFFILLGGGMLYIFSERYEYGIGYSVVMFILTSVIVSRKKKKYFPKRILEFIKFKKGNVTVLEVVTEFNLSPDDAKSKLDDLCVKIGGEVNISEKGVVIYFFSGFITDDEKKDVLQTNNKGIK